MNIIDELKQISKSKEIVNNILDSDNKQIYKDNISECKSVDEISNKWNMNNKIMDLFETNIKSDVKLKSKYAIILIIILIIQIILLNIWFCLSGLNIIMISESSFNLYIAGGMAEVFVLVGVIVKYLFKDNLKDSLNIILEGNKDIKMRNIKKIWKDVNNRS